MNSQDVRQKYIEFFVKRGHKEIPSAPLVPQNDPTTLFNSSGMQPLVPYLLGEPHPLGKRLVNSQKAIRTQDIEEVGDNRHTTFFEMLGNWSLGDYFKDKQLEYFWQFLTNPNEGLGLAQEKLYVSIFEGNSEVPRDDESFKKWLTLGVPKNHIFEYGVEKNWWSRSGTPDKMPVGEPGGPDSEVFYEFTSIMHDPKFGQKCHPNCDCGRFLEIGNSVFMQYKKLANGKLEELPNKNVDFGGGLERLAAATNDDPDVFKTDLFAILIERIEKSTGKKYAGAQDQLDMRVVADHIKAACFLIADGVIPGNKSQGYILRRLLRRAEVRMRNLEQNTNDQDFAYISEAVFEIYNGVYFTDTSIHEKVKKEIGAEIFKFNRTLGVGLKKLEALKHVDGKAAFDLYQTYGFPWELTVELVTKKGQTVDQTQFKSEFKKHQELSRSAAKGMFKGGLADQSTETTRLHTAHHLLLAALQKNVDSNIKQRGSNITAERLRIDFNCNRALTDDEKKKVEVLINQKIEEKLPVIRVEMKREDAEKLGAQMEFGAKYPETVSIYFVGLNGEIKPEHATPYDYFSAEFCGGPHVTNTSEIGTGGKKFKIIKEESVGSGVRRIKGILV